MAYGKYGQKMNISYNPNQDPWSNLAVILGTVLGSNAAKRDERKVDDAFRKALDGIKDPSTLQPSVDSVHATNNTQLPIDKYPMDAKNSITVADPNAPTLKNPFAGMKASGEGIFVGETPAPPSPSEPVTSPYGTMNKFNSKRFIDDFTSEQLKQGRSLESVQAVLARNQGRLGDFEDEAKKLRTDESLQTLSSLPEETKYNDPKFLQAYTALAKDNPAMAQIYQKERGRTQDNKTWKERSDYAFGQNKELKEMGFRHSKELKAMELQHKANERIETENRLRTIGANAGLKGNALEAFVLSGGKSTGINTGQSDMNVDKLLESARYKKATEIVDQAESLSDEEFANMPKEARQQYNAAKNFKTTVDKTAFNGFYPPEPQAPQPAQMKADYDDYNFVTKVAIPTARKNGYNDEQILAGLKEKMGDGPMYRNIAETLAPKKEEEKGFFSGDEGPKKASKAESSSNELPPKTAGLFDFTNLFSEETDDTPPMNSGDYRMLEERSKESRPVPPPKEETVPAPLPTEPTPTPVSIPAPTTEQIIPQPVSAIPVIQNEDYYNRGESSVPSVTIPWDKYASSVRNFFSGEPSASEEPQTDIRSLKEVPNTTQEKQEEQVEEGIGLIEQGLQKLGYDTTPTVQNGDYYDRGSPASLNPLLGNVLSDYNENVSGAKSAPPPKKPEESAPKQSDTPKTADTSSPAIQNEDYYGRNVSNETQITIPWDEYASSIRGLFGNDSSTSGQPDLRSLKEVPKTVQEEQKEPTPEGNEQAPVNIPPADVGIVDKALQLLGLGSTAEAAASRSAGDFRKLDTQSTAEKIVANANASNQRKALPAYAPMFMGAIPAVAMHSEMVNDGNYTDGMEYLKTFVSPKKEGNPKPTEKATTKGLSYGLSRLLEDIKTRPHPLKKGGYPMPINYTPNSDPPRFKFGAETSSLVNKVRALKDIIPYRSKDGTTNCMRTMGAALVGTPYEGVTWIPTAVEIARQRGELMDPKTYKPRPGDIAIMYGDNHSGMITETGGIIQNGQSRNGIYELDTPPPEKWVTYYIRTSDYEFI